ncbi:hypothetical protein BpHYR1_035319, partial [Brachionus plicatilis]
SIINFWSIWQDFFISKIPVKDGSKKKISSEIKRVESHKNFSVDDNSESDNFYLSKTIRNGQKLCSFGYIYTKERTTKKGFIHWKCEDTLTCSGRAHSEGEDVEITIAHSHKPDIARKNKLINDEKIKELAIKSKDNPRDILIETQKCDDEDVVLKSSYNNVRQ